MNSSLRVRKIKVKCAVSRCILRKIDQLIHSHGLVSEPVTHVHILELINGLLTVSVHEHKLDMARVTRSCEATVLDIEPDSESLSSRSL